MSGYRKPRIELADLFCEFRGELQLTPDQAKAVNSIVACRTSQLGGHVDECDSCGRQKISYNSCRNRHCPKCQFLAKEKWIEKCSRDLLPCPYFHVVFTIASELKPLAIRNKKLFFDLMFKAASATLKEVAANPKNFGADIGFIGILHTWTQELVFHPHIHFLVPGGGLAPGGTEWKRAKKGFFVSVKILSKVFRGKLLSMIETRTEEFSTEQDVKALLVNAAKKDWVIYCKKPFAGPKQVIRYLGKYTHRIAISNYRLIKLENGIVHFRCRARKKDNGNKAKGRVVSLPVVEFLRRFLQHVVPHGYTRIRHFGALGARNKSKTLDVVRKLLGVEQPNDKHQGCGWKEQLKELTGIDLSRCPHCKQGLMRTVQELRVGHNSS
jgi:hypothetical protein